MSQSGMAAVRVIEKRAVAVNVSLGALVKNMSDSAGVERRGELGTVGVLNAMHRPEGLLDPIKHDAFAWFFSWMIRCETAVIRWMPVFRGKNQIKLPLQLIGK